MRLSVLVLALVACGRGELERGARTTVTSGDPKPGASPTPSRTIDSTGFVDNGGRTSDMWGRTEASGARATEMGTNRPTGTNTGVPNGADLGGRGRERPAVPERAEVMPREGDSPVAGYEDVPARLARARCDHETTCTRVGDGRTWPSQDACMADFRARADAELGTCTPARAAVASCLAAIRNQPCTPALERRDALTACLSTALCSP